MTQDSIITMMRYAIQTIILVSAPPLMLALIVGLLISIFQTITSINEQTLTFVPKIIAVFLSLLIFGGFMLTNLQEFFVNLYSSIVSYIQ